MNPFVHHVPGPLAVADMTLLRAEFARLYECVSHSAGAAPSREKALALTHLQQASMWANLACVLADPESKPATRDSSSLT